jgi:hypothetical protein
VRDAFAREGRPTSEFRNITGMSGAHDALVVNRHVDKQPIERDVLLCVRTNQIMELKASDSQHGLAVQLGVVETVEQVNASRSGCCQTNAEFAGKLRVTARHKCGSFLMSHLNETDLVLGFSERFNEAVDSIAGKAEDRVDAPIHERFYNHISRCFRHSCSRCSII